MEDGAYLRRNMGPCCQIIAFAFFPSYVLSQYVKKNEMKNIFFWILSDEC